MVPHVITSCYHFFSIDVLASISVNFPGLFPLFLLVNVNMCLFHLVAINAKPLLQANNGAIASGKCITSHLALTEKKTTFTVVAYVQSQYVPLPHFRDVFLYPVTARTWLLKLEKRGDVSIR